MLHLTHKQSSLKKLVSLILLFTTTFIVLPLDKKTNAASSQTSTLNAMKKLALPLQQVVNGQITTETSWYKVNASVPFVQVFIQAYPSDTAALRTSITSVGGTVWSRYYSVNAVVAWLPANRLLEIAKRSDVERITPNYIVQQSNSLLEKATGVLNQRTFDPVTKQYTGSDGTGIGIAVLDSGVMASHKGFDDASGKSRIKAQVDVVQQNQFLQMIKDFSFLDSIPFQGRDNSQSYYDALKAPGVHFFFRNFLPNADKYGHGTHVAGIAAGRGNGAGNNTDVTGIAPNANIISIKVLDNEGIGQVSDVIKGIDWAILHKDEFNIRVINLSLGGSSTESYLNIKRESSSWLRPETMVKMKPETRCTGQSPRLQMTRR
jgi:serine protease AprX